ncbi:exodeoxyribonuclease V subunit beta [Colwelliaceae bacterium BS250]
MSKLCAQPLFAETLPLTGRHLIEASAGTGKTFNITRIYLRMLLERKISVENILVMTFTKAATEEIRGRIDEFLREALTNWQAYCGDESNSYFYHLGKVIAYSDAKILIKSALTNLDEAAIFTIHGFCKRVLSQQAFASGMNFNATMEVDDNDVVLEACQDHYRILALGDISQYQLFVEHWPTPESFLSSFKSILYDDVLPIFADKKTLEQNLQQLAKQSEQDLHQYEALIYEQLIDTKKGKARDTRIAEFEQLIHFVKQLKMPEQNITDLLSQSPDFKFIAANRLPKGEAKADAKLKLIAAFKTVTALHKQIKTYGNALLRSDAFSLVLDAVKSIKSRVSIKKKQLNMLNFDDLISQLEYALSAQNESLSLTNTLITQYPVALIDEFQDTDPKQFSILKHLYFTDATEHHTSTHTAANTIDDTVDESADVSEHKSADTSTSALYLIGDPKQAIYGFRGGDIFTYLAAGQQVDQQWVMDTNWRSSTNMIAAYNHLFYGNNLADTAKDVFGFGINYQPVKASVTADNECLVDDSDFKAMQFIDFDAPEQFQSRGVIKSDFRAVMADWTAVEVARLLQSATLQQKQKTTTEQPTKDQATNEQPVTHKAIKAGDIAILVRDGKEANTIKDALNALNISCVYQSQRSNLFLSDIAFEFINVLNAIINHEDDRAFVAALSGPYFAYDPQRLYELQYDELQWERIRSQFNSLKDTWFKRGFMAMALRILHDYYPGSSTGSTNTESADSEHHSSTDNNKERELTNIIHLFELLQTASQRLKQPQELLAFLQQQCVNPASGEAELRLESDADLVQIITQHGSKGLEYPIVFIPFVSRHKNPSKFGVQHKQVLRYHDEQGVLQIHLSDDDVHRSAMAQEGYAEDIRLLYVAITRAKHRCYLGYCDFQESHLSPVGQTLGLSKGQPFSDAIATLNGFCPQAIGLLTLCDDEFSGEQVADPKALTEHAPAAFKGIIERDWWLSSFSALTRNVRHKGRIAPDRDLSDDKHLTALKKDVIRFAFVKGAKTGNLLHDVFERTDFAAPDWPKNAYHSLIKFGQLPQGFEPEDVYAWFDDCLLAKLNSNGLTLAQLPVKQTLKESEFYFPMDNVNLNALKNILNTFRKSLNIPSQQLNSVSHELPAFGYMKGMMHGFIDLIFCDDIISTEITGSDTSNSQQSHHASKYYVCDYKSSHLGNHFNDYSAENLSLHIIENFYDLQFLIYSLALHRYLQRRIADYSFERDFGGVYYLYLRGMSENNDNFQGIFYHALSAQLLTDLDNAFSGVSNTKSTKKIVIAEAFDASSEDE